MPPGLLICSQFLLKDQEDTTDKATYSQIRSPEGLAPLLTKEDQVTNTEDFSILNYIKCFRRDPEELGNPFGKQYKSASCRFPNHSEVFVLSDKALNYPCTCLFPSNTTAGAVVKLVS